MSTGTPTRRPPGPPTAATRAAGVVGSDGPVAVPTPPASDTWVALTTGPLGAAPVGAWADVADAGAVVTFTGTVRDHAPGRDDVTALVYEAYDEVATDRLRAVVDDVRRHWPAVRRVAALHRTGRLAVGDVAVVVAVSAPHRADAFGAASHCIDTLKATVPLWKKESWVDGEAWGTDAAAIVEVPGPGPGAAP